jgi:hypothetical protein
MTTPPPDELPADVIELLGLERQSPAAPEAARVRVAHRLGLKPGAAGASVPAAVRPWWGSGAVKIALLVVAGASGTAAWLATRRAPAPPVQAPEPPPAAVPDTPAPSPVTPPAAARATSPPPEPARRDTEIDVLGRARRALARGDARQALTELGRHQQRWPRGQLTQEREVLAIQALAATGANAEARARADRFLAQFPESTLSATVRQLRRGLDDR